LGCETHFKSPLHCSLQMDQDNLHIEFLALNVDFNGSSPDLLGYIFWFQMVIVHYAVSAILGVLNNNNYRVRQKFLPPWGFLIIFPKRLRIFKQNFTRLLSIQIYAKLQNFIQLSPTMTKLCRIKRDHPPIFTFHNTSKICLIRVWSGRS